MKINKNAFYLLMVNFVGHICFCIIEKMESITFTIKNPTSEVSIDISKRVDNLLKDMNVLSSKYEYVDHISYDIFSLNDPNLEKIKFEFNIVKEQTGYVVESIATLETINLEYNDPSKACDGLKTFSISNIDETKPVTNYTDIINLFKSEFDFDINYDYRDIGYLMAYLIHNKHLYEQPLILREEAYESYINFCNRNYLKYAFTKHIFGKKIKMFCNIKQKDINGKRVKRYYLSTLGKSCIEDPEIYYALLKKEEDKKRESDDISDSDEIACSESFDKYFEENKDSYKSYTFTKIEAYNDYKDFCKINLYKPIPISDFYRSMLNECIVKRSNEKNGSECFIIERYSYIPSGTPVEYSNEAREQIEKRIDAIKAQVAKIEDVVKDFINHYHDDFKSYNYTRPEAFDLYKEYCTTNNQEPISKLLFNKEMRKYCIERRHRPSTKEDPKIYFILRSNEVAPDSSN